jgi:hypothetical protein
MMGTLMLVTEAEQLKTTYVQVQNERIHPGFLKQFAQRQAEKLVLQRRQNAQIVTHIQEDTATAIIQYE